MKDPPPCCGHCVPSKGLKPLLDVTVRVPRLFMGLSGPLWLFQCLRYHRGSFFVTARCTAVLAVQRGPVRAAHVPHSLWLWRGCIMFCFICCNYKEISLDFGAGSSGFHVSHLVPAQTRWSFAAIRGRRSARCVFGFFCFFFFPLNPSFLNCSGLTVYDSLFLCACLLRVYRCVHAFQLYQY